MSTTSERRSEVPDTDTVIDHRATKHGPDDIPALEQPLLDGIDDAHPIASAPLPSYGTE